MRLRPARPARRGYKFRAGPGTGRTEWAFIVGLPGPVVADGPAVGWVVPPEAGSPTVRGG